ncbi:MAG: geranylgeranylglyceryl/heptaprenylglyceryl phosphate synthase [Halobacteriales archaeon]|nr:geranylgeranylglyceryl/heptaprenylglyceryl phosphate synthase [Halobacteriales archaeon]
MAWVDDLTRAGSDLLALLRSATRASGLIDTNPVPRQWEHITKVDPEDEKPLPLLFPLYLRHTSAVSIGGSQDVTTQNTVETFSLLDHATVPFFHEPSAPHHITDRTWRGSRFTMIPEVLNGDSNALVGELGAAIDNIRRTVAPDMLTDRFPWLPDRLRAGLADVLTSWVLDQAVFEAYIIQNLDSAAAEEANVTASDRQDPTGAAQRALAAERHLDSEIIYLEYSGRFGGEEAIDILEAIDDAVSWSRIWYGGGIETRADATSVLNAGADGVVVGNVFHEIALAEADLCSRAEAALDPDANLSEIRAWVTEGIDIAETSAARYLGTIPTVGDPETRAREYLTATVDTWLSIVALEDELSDRQAIRTAVTGEEVTIPGVEHLRAALGDASEAVATAITRGVLEERSGVDDSATLPAAHLGPINETALAAENEETPADVNPVASE